MLYRHRHCSPFAENSLVLSFDAEVSTNLLMHIIINSQKGGAGKLTSYCTASHSRRCKTAHAMGVR